MNLPDQIQTTDLDCSMVVQAYLKWTGREVTKANVRRINDLARLNKLPARKEGGIWLFHPRSCQLHNANQCAKDVLTQLDTQNKNTK